MSIQQLLSACSAGLLRHSDAPASDNAIAPMEEI